MSMAETERCVVNNNSLVAVQDQRRPHPKLLVNLMRAALPRLNLEQWGMSSKTYCGNKREICRPFRSTGETGYVE